MPRIQLGGSFPFTTALTLSFVILTQVVDSLQSLATGDNPDALEIVVRTEVTQRNRITSHDPFGFLIVIEVS